MKRPSFQFYPADWRGNAKLRRCSEAARGAWVDILCVLHDADEYGVCRWPLADLARAAGASPRAVQELVRNDVLKGAERDAAPFVYTPRHANKDGEPVTLVAPNGGPVWYSSRLVRDEYVRLRRGSSTQFTAVNQPPKLAPKSTPNGGMGERQGDGASSSSSSSSSKQKKRDPADAGSPVGQKVKKVTFQAWMAAIPPDAQAIPEGHPVFAYAERVGIPAEFLDLAWAWFKRKYADSGKKYTPAGWPKLFKDSVDGNWGRLWWTKPGGDFELTTPGVQLQRALAADAADSRSPATEAAA